MVGPYCACLEVGDQSETSSRRPISRVLLDDTGLRLLMVVDSDNSVRSSESVDEEGIDSARHDGVVVAETL